MKPQNGPRWPATSALVAGVVALALCGSLLAATQAVEPEKEPGEPSRGAVLYKIYCTSCHGPEGAGDGPVANELRKRPPDLRRIAARRGGRFPSREIERIIDGRVPVEPHGASEMPVWGLSFRQPGRLADQEEEVWLRVRRLVEHLRSLQVGVVIDEG